MFINLYDETMEAIDNYNYTKKDVKNVWFSKNKVISFERFCEIAKKINYNNKINDFDNWTCNLDGTKRKENINPATRIYFNDGNFLRRSVYIKDKRYYIEYWVFQNINSKSDIYDNLKDDEIINLIHNG